MKTKHYQILLFCAIMSCFLRMQNLYAQSSNLDSLKTALELAQSLSEKIKTVNEIIPMVAFKDGKMYYMNILDSLAQASVNPEERVNTLYKLGGYYKDANCFELADRSFRKAIREAESLPKEDVPEQQAAICLSQAENLVLLSDFTQAAELLTSVGTYYENHKNYDQLIKVYTALATIYTYHTPGTNVDKNKGIIDQMGYYYERIIALYPLVQNETSIVSCFNAYVNYLTHIKKDYDEAFIYLHKLDSLSRKMNFPTGQILFYGNSGFVSEQKGNFKEAVRLYYKTYEVAAANDKMAYAAQALANAAFLSSKLKDLESCRKYSLIGLDIAEKYDIKTQKWRFLDNLSNIAEEEKKFEQALQYRNKCVAAYISVFSENNANQINQYAARFESLQKESKIKNLESESEIVRYQYRKNIQLTLFLGIIIILSIVIFSAIIWYRRKLALKQRQIHEQKITQLEQEKQLVASQAVLDGETAERTRLARDLHDGLGGMLSVVKLNLNDLKKGAAMEGEDVRHFNQALDVLEESIRELRRVAHNLMPDSLIRYGLKASLTDFCNSIPIAELYYFGNDERLDPKLEIMIYRTVHELVNNVLKYARANKIIVQIVQEIDRLALTVQDDGCGFDVSAETTGTGLNNIRNRVKLYNGRLDIWSKPDKGTEASAEFKLGS